MYQLGDQAIFTGDTLVLRERWSPDLADEAEGYAHHLFHSLHDRVLPLNDKIMVFPAHFGSGVEVHSGQFVARHLGELRHTLAPLTFNEDEFVTWAIANVKDRPGNYRQIVVSTRVKRSWTRQAAELEWSESLRGRLVFSSDVSVFCLSKASIEYALGGERD